MVPILGHPVCSQAFMYKDYLLAYKYRQNYVLNEIVISFCRCAHVVILLVIHFVTHWPSLLYTT